MAAKKQLTALPSVRSLYVKAKNQLLNDTKSACHDHFQTLSVQKNKLSWRQPVELGTDSYLVSIQASYHLFQEPLLTLFQLTLICITGIFSVMQNVLYNIM